MEHCSLSAKKITTTSKGKKTWVLSLGVFAEGRVWEVVCMHVQTVGEVLELILDNCQVSSSGLDTQLKSVLILVFFFFLEKES